MARISNLEREKKKSDLDAIVLTIFWEEGIDALTYARVAESYNTSRGAIQRYYPSQNDFYTSLRGKVMPLMLEKLDWSSINNFHNSWISELSNTEDCRFKRVIELLFHNA